MLALYGKHPSKGDFIGGGLPVQAGLEGWLDSALAEARHGLDSDWETVWGLARPLRFWIGPSIWGETSAGVLAASADKVGRRYPLLIAGFGAECPPCPVIDPVQDWHGAVEAKLVEMLAGETAELNGFSARCQAQMPSGPPEFWAARPGADVVGLLEDIVLTDHHRASHNRSYWWIAGDDFGHSQVWAGEGLPSGHVIAWFLRGYAENG
ncbi:type VI secretion system-associated protein TagF [Cypionkella sp.]|uniref:type VI secretion system-associated protein TagF n=1 Tax=Cypionkella sp. TaxID=2811411 RepID=UPI00261BDAE5|nr:type VI secretion system-associated protein TagF [Cypionkella sp.]